MRKERRDRLFAAAALVTATAVLSGAGTAAAATGPIVSVGTASGVSTSSATISGTVNPNGQAATWWIEYGTGTSYGSTTTSKSAGSGTTDVDVSSTLSGLAPGTTYHFRIVATSSAGTTQGADATLLTVAAPAVVTGAAASVGASAATLNGTVNPNGNPTTWYFDYGTSTSYGSKTASQSAGSGTVNVDASAALSSLAPGTTYHFRIVATSSAGTTQGADATFLTVAAPAVATGAATGLSAGAGTLNGTVDPNGRATTWYFDYGTSTSYGSKTASQSAGSGTVNVDVSSTLSSLAAGTTYHFRVVAVSDAGTTSGGDKTFSTTGSAPVAATAAASSVTASGAKLNGSVNPDGQATTTWFEYGTSTSYGTKTPVLNVGSGTRSTSVSASISSLGSATTYHFRLVASNASGTIAGNDRTLVTSGPPTVQTGAGQGIGPTTATLTGSLDPNGRSTSWYFEYGQTTSYGSRTTTKSAGSGTAATVVSAAVSGLAQGTGYHFRLVASSGGVTSYAADAMFTTTGSVVTLRAAAFRVVYGRAVTLSGAVSTRLPGEMVTVLAERFGESAYTPVGTVSTGSGGGWSYGAAPTIRTSYEASWRAGTSSATLIGVSPAVSLRQLSKTRFSTHVAGGSSFAGRIVQLQRRAGGRWTTVSRARLNGSSSAVLRPQLPRGTSSLRIALSVNQAGAGFLAGFSRTVAYRRG